MSDGTEYHTTIPYPRESSATVWSVGIIVALALLAIGYIVFSANETERLDPDQVRCMIANPGVECSKIQRWEPVKTVEKPY